ncbi:MAG: hypothetical protein CVU60_08080 [Deltaproteobacteria bacterium HGW-Deltaproteobacteria-18]|nr:MAG: hypothetical protein CVU60_08080 [Deltaproteobacteria bacterium HGW-Deltaproteobacteria-18]
MAVGGVKGQDIHFCPELGIDRQRVYQKNKLEIERLRAERPILAALNNSPVTDKQVDIVINNILSILEKHGLKRPERPSDVAKQRGTLEAIMANGLMAADSCGSTSLEYALHNGGFEKFYENRPWVCYFRKFNRYPQLKAYRLPVSHKYLLELIDLMAKADLVESERADGSSSGKGLASRYRLSPNVLAWLTWSNVDHSDLAASKPAVIIKDSSKRIVAPPRFSGEYDQILAASQKITDYVAKIDVWIKDDNGDDITLCAIEEGLRRRADAASLLKESELDDHTANVIAACSEAYAIAARNRVRTYRVFNNESLQEGGRRYGHWLQCIRKKWRKRAIMGGHPTVTLDFKAIHLHICYALQGLMPPTGDLYVLDVQDFRREIAKTMALIVINCKDMKSAKLAMRKHSSKEGWNLTTKDINAYIAAFVAKHSAINQYFCSAFGTKAQYYDSEIAESVLQKLMSLDIPCIPIFDGFVVREQDAALLGKAMDEASAEVLGRVLPWERE